MTAEPGAHLRLGDGEIPGGHVCVLFDGADDFYEQLAPFVADGFERGERAVHIVDPSKRDDHLARLAAAGIDVDSATDRGQLEVESWPEFYLVGGRFQPEVTVKLLKATLDAGRERGYRATRAIGMMDWVLERALGVDAIASYEAIVDGVLRSSNDAVVCAYDVRRHRPSMFVDLLALHAYALLKENTKILSFEPHLHAPGARMCLEAIWGYNIQTINCVGYDHNWETHPDDIASTPPGEDPETEYPSKLLSSPAGR